MRTIPTDAAPIHVVASLDDANELWAWLKARRSLALALDLETNGENPYDQGRFRLRLAQFSNGIDGWVVQAERPGMLEVIKHCIHEHPYWVAHFPGFAEIRFLHHGCPGAVRVDQREPHIVDTQTALAVYDPRTVTTEAKKDRIDPRIPLSRNLKQVVTRCVGDKRLIEADSALYDRFKEIAPRNEKGNIALRSADAIRKHGFANIDIDDETYLIYGGYDAIFEARLWHIIAQEIKRRGQWGLVSADLRWQWHADLMTAVRGIPVDGPYVKWLAQELDRVIDENHMVLEWNGIKDSAMGGGVGRAFESFGVQSPKETKKGKTSWDRWVIADIVAKHDEDHPAGQLARAIQIVRRATKFRSAYVKPMLDSLEYDGKVHCSLHVAGTLTGRNSASEPPVQQLPKYDKRVRAAFHAPDGWVFVTSDFRQGEPRVMAARSGDENLKRDILSGDFNSALATRSFGDLYDPRFGKDPGTPHFLMRQGAKAGYLALCYGAGIKKFAETLGVGYEEGRVIYERIRAAYPRLWAYADRLNRQDAVILDSGRRIPLWDRYYVDEHGVHVNPNKHSRLGLNYDTQGTQRDLLSIAVHRHIDHDWAWALAMFMHDELVSMVPADRAMEYARFQKWSMTMEYMGMPIECETDGIDTPGPFRETWMQQPSAFDLRELEVMDDDE